MAGDMGEVLGCGGWYIVLRAFNQLSMVSFQPKPVPSPPQFSNHHLQSFSAVSPPSPSLATNSAAAALVSMQMMMSIESKIEYSEEMAQLCSAMNIMFSRSWLLSDRGFQSLISAFSLLIMEATKSQQIFSISTSSVPPGSSGAIPPSSTISSPSLSAPSSSSSYFSGATVSGDSDSMDRSHYHHPHLYHFSSTESMDGRKATFYTSLFFFSLQRIEEICMSNISRLDAIWDDLFPAFKLFSESTNAGIRQLGIDLLIKIVTQAFVCNNSTQIPDHLIADREVELLRQRRSMQQKLRAQLQHAPVNLLSSSPSSSPSLNRTYFPNLQETLLQQSNEEETEESRKVSRFIRSFMQHRCLESLEHLSRSPHIDVREKVLNGIYSILQSSGQSFSKVWPLLLSILMTVAVNDDKPLISDAFQSVQFICSDFLSNLPLDCLALFITTIGCYGIQLSVINVSIRAISLLMNIADYLGKEGPRLRTVPILKSPDFVSDSSTSTDLVPLPPSPPLAPLSSAPDSTLPTEDHSSPTVTVNPIDKIWLALLREIRQLGRDKRSEVRNASILTLCKSVSTHGRSFEPTTWNECMWQIFFPILSEIHTMTASADQKEFSVELGNRGGVPVKLMMHHSRNNAQKQWEETAVLGFGGVSRVFKQFFDLLLPTPSFVSIWTRFMQLGELFVLSNSLEVSQKTILSLEDLIQSIVISFHQKRQPQPQPQPQAQAQATTEMEEFPREIWSVYWKTLVNVSLGLSNPDLRHHPQGPTPESTLETMVSCLLRLHESIALQFSVLDEKDLLELLPPLCVASSHVSPSSASVDSAAHLSQVQKIVLELFKSYSSVSDFQKSPSSSLSSSSSLCSPESLSDQDAIFVHHFYQLYRIVEEATGGASQLSSKPTLSSPRQKSQINKNLFPLAEEIVKIINQALLDRSTPRIQAIVFESAISTVHSAMSTKFSFFSTSLWRTSVRSLCSIIETCLPSLYADGSLPFSFFKVIVFFFD